MKNLMRLFIVTVLAADLLAIVYFAGHFTSTGHLLPAHAEAENPVLAALTPEEDSASEGHAAKEAAPIDVGALLLAGNPEIGQKVANKCKACHTFEQGGANKVGPNLWGVVGAKMAHLDSFSYTSGFAERHAAGEVWTEEKLFEFLAAPGKYIPGTKMSLALRKPEERADLISYLKTLK